MSPALSHYVHKTHSISRCADSRDQNRKNCIVKSVRGHWRLQNEADILRRYQWKTPFLRPIIDKVLSPADPPSIILRHLDSELLVESKRKRLTRPEIKQVARCILEALLILHKDGMVHTGIARLLSPLESIPFDTYFRCEIRQCFCQLWPKRAALLRNSTWRLWRRCLQRFGVRQGGPSHRSCLHA
jgi:hypothetical protein